MQLKRQLGNLDREQATLYWALRLGRFSQLRVIIIEMVATKKRGTEISCASDSETLAFQKFTHPLVFP